MGIATFIITLFCVAGLGGVGYFTYRLWKDEGVDALRQRITELEAHNGRLEAKVERYQESNFQFASIVLTRLGITTPEQRDEDLTIFKRQEAANGH